MSRAQDAQERFLRNRKSSFNILKIDRKSVRANRKATQKNVIKMPNALYPQA